MNWIILMTAVVLLWSQIAVAVDRTYLEVSPHDQDDLASLFTILEESRNSILPATDPVVIVLHGTEALPFTRIGYKDNRDLVDRAALLDAYRLIDVKMCETWMKENGVDLNDIPAFIETVPFAPEEIERLEAEGYLPHDSVNI